MLFHALLFWSFSLTWANCPSDTMCEPSFKKCYKFITDPTDFFNAEEKCVSFGGHLVSIHNAFENAIIGETALSMFVKQTDYWIGANYILKNEWSWTDGSAWNYNDWFPGEPKFNQTVTVILKSNFWQATDPTESKPFVCQLPIVPTTTPTSLTSPTVTSQTCQPPCESGWTWNSVNNYCYKVLLWKKFWDAEKLCQQLGAHLASIHSEQENIFVSELAASGVSTDQAGMLTQIGIYQSSEQWYWTDNTPVDYSNWGSGLITKYSSLCGCIFPDGFTHNPGWYQKWETESCEFPMRNFVCKKKAN